MCIAGNLTAYIAKASIILAINAVQLSDNSIANFYITFEK